METNTIVKLSSLIYKISRIVINWFLSVALFALVPAGMYYFVYISSGLNYIENGAQELYLYSILIIIVALTDHEIILSEKAKKTNLKEIKESSFSYFLIAILVLSTLLYAYAFYQNNHLLIETFKFEYPLIFLSFFLSIFLSIVGCVTRVRRKMLNG